MAEGTNESGPRSFAGRTVWVVGASRGLGAATARAFAAAGATVFASSRSRDSLESLAKESEKDAPGTIKALPASVTSSDEIESAVAEIEAQAGRLDVLVANAGVSPSFSRPENISDEEWLQILDTNLTGVFRCCKAARPLMTEGSSVVNVSSAHSISGHSRLAAYAASKGGVESLTRCLALEWAKAGIRVNAVAPGYIATDMTSGLLEHDRWSKELLGRIPLGRFANTDDIVDPILFLAGEGARYVTGTTLFVDGGWTAQ